MLIIRGIVFEQNNPPSNTLVYVAAKPLLERILGALLAHQPARSLHAIQDFRSRPVKYTLQGFDCTYSHLVWNIESHAASNELEN